RMSLAAIVRVTGVSSQWLQTYVNKKLVLSGVEVYEETPQDVNVKKKIPGKLTIRLVASFKIKLLMIRICFLLFKTNILLYFELNQYKNEKIYDQ
ncbi:MAG: hypothetical protein F6K39_44890, partial [Okeania sp. SIO3B3]|nr:hypothetical protein [Okeania sp. SIO3B3]